MSNAPAHGDDGRELAVPEALRDALGRVSGRGPVVPPAVDEAVLAMARDRFARVRRQRMVLRWVAGAAAAAAAVGMVVWVAERPRSSTLPLQVAVRSQSAAPSPPVGRVTILDAFRLAREIEGGARPAREWDVNGDGFVDRRDVDTLAMQAVSVSKGRV